MSFTRPTLRHVSRIYQDLRSRHFQSVSGLSPKQLENSLDTCIMAPNARVSYSAIMNSVRGSKDRVRGGREVHSSLPRWPSWPILFTEIIPGNSATFPQRMEKRKPTVCGYILTE